MAGHLSLITLVLMAWSIRLYQENQQQPWGLFKGRFCANTAHVDCDGRIFKRDKNYSTLSIYIWALPQI